MFYGVIAQTLNWGAVFLWGWAGVAPWPMKWTWHYVFLWIASGLLLSIGGAEER